MNRTGNSSRAIKAKIWLTSRAFADYVNGHAAAAGAAGQTFGVG